MSHTQFNWKVGFNFIAVLNSYKNNKKSIFPNILKENKINVAEQILHINKDFSRFQCIDLDISDKRWIYEYWFIDPVYNFKFTAS